jgi:Omp85 superfamily domain
MKTLRRFRKFRVSFIILSGVIGGVCLLLSGPAAGCSILPTAGYFIIEPQNSQDVAQQSSSNPSPAPDQTSSPAPDQTSSTTTNQKPETEAEKKAAKKKKKTDENGSFIVAPQPLVSPAIGAGIIPIAAYITPLPAKDKEITPSVIGGAGLITNNGSRGFALGADLYLDKARYEVETGYVQGFIDYNLYGVGFANGNAGFKLPLEQSGHAYFLKALRRIKWDTYVGGRFTTGSSFITIKPTSTPPAQLPPIPPDAGLHTNLRALGVEVYRDSRPNRFYPLKGSLLDFTGDFFANDLGSKYSFQSYKFTYNKYVSLSKKQVLAGNFFWCGTGGSPPFYGNCIYGTNNELRGYTAGRYLDRFMLATQVEFRQELKWRFGVVGFAGVGAVAPGGADIRANQFLPAGGTGIRYDLSKKYHVNLRTDFAWGKDNFTWAVGVGEAF